VTPLRSVVLLSGGVGGARLAHGLDRALPPGALTVIVNTGDDLEHWGLSISPDLDTVMYTLAELAHVERGWGLADETFHAHGMMQRYGAAGWFALGDRDLATHMVRTEAKRSGETLTAITARLCSALDVRSAIRPMCDERFETRIATTTMGTLPFQDWLVRERARPPVRKVFYEGTQEPAPGLLDTIHAADLVVIGPSNPYVSIDPILSLHGVRKAVFDKTVIAVSPLRAGRAVKGPLATMIGEIDGAAPGTAWLVDHYSDLTALVVQHGDEADANGLPMLATETLMPTRADSLLLARELLTFAEGLA
jgi:LPPG:FO 2-phospho-L-lactate transferase